MLSQVESFIQRLSQATAEERLQELEETADLPEFHKSRKRSGLIGLFSFHRSAGVRAYEA